MAAASGYGSDEEVYATARAVDDAEYGDSDSGAPLDKKKIESLPPLDHATVEYEDFAKVFYDEHPAMTAMTHAEVRHQVQPCLHQCGDALRFKGDLCKGCLKDWGAR